MERSPNATRHRRDGSAGHYESFFLRANHPERPLAFWIRYTIFSPMRRPQEALGELWAIVFDGEARRWVAVKREVPLDHCRFGGPGLDVRVGEAVLTDTQAEGAVESGGHAVRWRLALSEGGAPLFLLPPAAYEARLPRAKSLVPRPLAVFDGALVVDGEPLDVRAWIGSQNHNWGERHTDRYAWGQVAGFDGAPGSFLEVATAWLRLGPLWTPPMTPLVLRHDGREHRLTAPLQILRARAAVGYFHWSFACESRELAVRGTIEAPSWAMACLRYRNPPGGEKHCLNTKIASCRLRLRHKRSGGEETLATAHRAAFEILTDDRTHGVPIAV